MSGVDSRERLRIAVQKSGRLAEPSQDLLSRCGLSFRRRRDKLFCYGETLAIDLLLVRDDDIPGLIAQGVCDLGIVGRNVVNEFALDRGVGQTAIDELLALDFGRCRLVIAVPQGNKYVGPKSLEGSRIATTYAATLDKWLRRNGVRAHIVSLSGSVEIAPRLGSADAVCDLVSSGATLAANRLREVDTVLESEAVLIAAAECTGGRAELRELLLRRIDGVLDVRESKLVLLHAPRAALAAIERLLPGAPAPSVTAVEGKADEVSLQALCRGSVTWQHLEDMKRAGATRLFVLPVEKMLA